MRVLIFTAILVITYSAGCSSTSEPVSEAPQGYEDWELVWSDEFNYTGYPDPVKWDYDIGGSGWGNNELQYYSARQANARVENGKLIIEALRESYNGMEYTSARLVTRGKGDWTYGRFEIRAKLPYGRGTWPAIWMLPTEWTYGNKGWPDNGEIDIMEHVGYNAGWIHASTHSNLYNHSLNTQKTGTLYVADASAAFHTYTVEWSADTIKAFVDTTQYFTALNNGAGWKAWPFDKDFHLILNIAIGGSWGGVQGVDNSIFPQRMEVEYVRAYKRKND